MIAPAEACVGVRRSAMLDCCYSRGGSRLDIVVNNAGYITKV
jgi:hypothetical protein